MNTHFFPFGQMISMYRVGHGWIFERLIGKLSSNRHTILLAEEGWGEMEFVRELGFQLREKFPDIHCCYIDCRQVYSRDSFLELFARSLLHRFPEVSIREDLDLMSLDAFGIPLIIAKRKKIRLAIFITSCHPFYVTLLTWHTLIRAGRVCTREDVQSALKDILLHYDHQFNLIVERLTDRQLNLLIAIVEGKELIEQRYREYVIVDPIFKVWLRQQYQDQGPTAS